MNLDYPHLTPGTAELLAGSDNERISAIREERWVTYPRARFSLEVLEALLARARTTRMPVAWRMMWKLLWAAFPVSAR